jgi:hypothetical protein
MKNSILTKTLIITATVSLFTGCVERPVYVQQPPPGAPPQAEVVTGDPAPPPPQVEVIPIAPDPAFIWIGGGRWAPRPHPGAVWMRGHWGHRGHGRVWIHSGWR